MKALTKVKATAIVKAPTVAELVDQFIASQDVRTSSKDLYRRTLNLYFSWLLRAGLQIRDITRVEILRYKQDLLDSGMSPLTVGSYLTVVRKFYEWAESCKLYPNVAKGIKTPNRKQQFRKQALTATQSGLLLLQYCQPTGCIPPPDLWR